MINQNRGTSKNSALKSRMSAYSKSPKPIQQVMHKKTGQMFMTKKEKEAKELQAKRDKALKDNQKRMLILNKEIEEM